MGQPDDDLYNEYDQYYRMIDSEIDEFNKLYPDARWGAAHIILEDKNSDSRGYYEADIDTMDSLIVHLLGGKRECKDQQHFDGMLEYYTKRNEPSAQNAIDILDELMATRNFLANILWRYEFVLGKQKV